MTETSTPDAKKTLTRRAAMVGVAGVAAAVALPEALQGQQGADDASQPAALAKPEATVSTPNKPTRQPVVFLPHGGGPWPFVQLGFAAKEEEDHLAAYLKSVAHLPGASPKALLVISAHWEAPVATVMTAAAPPMLYDYYGFPPASYQITWPAPGNPALAARVQQLLGAAGMATAADPARGFDHGTFVPLKLTYPEAQIPTIQLSLLQGLDPARHLALGRALAPLREEGVLIVGSGMTYHNLRAFGPAGVPHAKAFDQWLQAAATAAPAERDAALASWQLAPSARFAHPREEHLLPLMVVAGAAGADRGRLAFTGTLRGLALSAYHYGEATA